MNTREPHDEHYDEEPLPEGEEKAPPLTRTMGTIRWIILAALVAFALVMILGYFGFAPWSTSSSEAQQYHCPMHPTYVSSQAGDCPICGMSLVPIGAKLDVDSAAKAEHGTGASPGNLSVAEPGQYYCPMDPEVASDTAGRCPICKMHLEKFEPGMKFTCEMHPEVITDKPGDCPKCGMDLMPLESSGDASTGAPAQAEAGVPGLVPVTLEPERVQLIGVRTGKVERRELIDANRLAAYVTADESRLRTVNVRVSGWVQKLLVAETGRSVRAGEPLLTIYSQELFQAAQEHLAILQRSLSSGSDSPLGATHATMLQASRDRLRLLGMSEDDIGWLETKRKVDREITLYSRFDGVILAKAVQQGQFVSPDQILFTIADLGKVWVLADVYEPDVAGIKVGQPAQMTVLAYPGESFTGKVTFVYPTVTDETRTLKVRLEFDNPHMKLRPGMFAEVSLSTAGEPVLAIPREALLDGGQVAYAFVVNEGTHFEPRQVQVGRRTGDWVEVAAGLREGETVVTSANFLIDSESRLRAAISGMGSTQADPHAGHTLQKEPQ